MQFQTKILLLSFIASVVVSIFVIPILKKLKIGQMEREEGPESHLKKQGTPTMGGIIMIIVILAVTIYGYFDYLGDNQINISNNLLPLLFVTIGFGIVGFIDDFKKLILKNTKGLSPKAKMIGLLIVSVGYILALINIYHIQTDIYIPFTNMYITLPTWLYVIFTIMVMIATTNAINLTDGVDGLSTSVTTIIITCLTVISIIFQIKEITIFGSILIGTCLGFLLFNLHPAKVMMGDTGSLMLRWSNCRNCNILKNATFVINYCYCSCDRNSFCNDTSGSF